MLANTYIKSTGYNKFTSARELFEEEILNERKDLKSIK